MTIPMNIDLTPAQSIALISIGTIYALVVIYFKFFKKKKD